MTPSINALAESAKEVGKYLLETEWEVVEETFLRSSKNTYEDFLECVSGTIYFHALVCAESGQESEISDQLKADFDYLQGQLRVTEIEKARREQVDEEVNEEVNEDCLED
jgi:hypothetical protein